ncbi:hypothetical protein B0H13DRAFT_1999591 [Mycena leptocephala]|nr:hypothetical protein B0H13DRAFT_1999591 [Mycena leptocephala]
MAIPSKPTTLVRGTRPMKKKALLIGIGYKESKSQEQLHMPHEDVTQLKAFLINTYGYSEQDITVMLDRPGEHPGELQPTLKKSVQVPELSGDQTELDGMDEVMVPSDGHTANPQTTRESCLVDNELKRLLINPLPAEASFMALLDTCHSASLLDLDHGECNAKWSCLRDTTQLRKIIPLHYGRAAAKQIAGLRTTATPYPGHRACARRPHTNMPSAFHISRCESPVPDPCYMPLVISLSACKDDQRQKKRALLHRAITQHSQSVLRYFLLCPTESQFFRT